MIDTEKVSEINLPAQQPTSHLHYSPCLSCCHS